MKTKIYLGKVKSEIKTSQCYNPEKKRSYIEGENLYFEKHKWSCGWYWSFGYLGNNDLHCHADTFINDFLWHDAFQVFETTIFSNNSDFWIFKDLLKQAYTLQKCAEIYQYGGHCISKEGVTDIIQNKRMAAKMNKDLEKILNSLWSFLEELSK